LASCLIGKEKHLCAATDTGLIDLSSFSARTGRRDIPVSLDQAVQNWDSARESISGLVKSLPRGGDSAQFLVERSSKFLPPIATPSKILCVFVNYRSHGQEMGSAPSEPVFFFKHSNSIVGDGDDVIVPKFSLKADHEVELGAVIGRRGKDISPGLAYEYVAGYTVLNDVSFRDGMKRGIEGTVLGRNLYRGKVADTALPMGPWLVTRDEIGEPYPLRISLKVNGALRQEGTTDDMIFKVPDLIASASEDNTLLPGDVIATGTCSGVGLYTGKYLNDGDVMEAEVEKVGVLRNTVRMQKTATA
jgi:2-keto-4-pentenoate hydratase/2-oxohepta-3-ene-1,7-dioic acid hydratase in catechol pathway